MRKWLIHVDTVVAVEEAHAPDVVVMERWQMAKLVTTAMVTQGSNARHAMAAERSTISIKH